MGKGGVLCWCLARVPGGGNGERGSALLVLGEGCLGVSEFGDISLSLSPFLNHTRTRWMLNYLPVVVLDPGTFIPSLM